MGLSKRSAWRAAAGLFAAAAALLCFFFRAPQVEDRVYRIGWQIDPPYQSRGADGQASGVAVDLVREAARRRGIRLEWVFSDGSESALRSRKVDLWPLITITPDRLKYFHITQPYIETELALLTLEASSYTTVPSLADASIAVYAIPIRSRYLQSLLPKARILKEKSALNALRDVCIHHADAAFVESDSAVSVLLAGGSCSDVALRWIGVPEIRSRLGVGAVFEAKGAAEAIREEIGEMAAEGKLRETMGQWDYISGQHLESIQALQNARRQQTRLWGGIFVVVLLLLIAFWQAVRARRERNRSLRAEQAQRGSEAQFRSLLESVQLSGTVFDAQGIMTFCNDFFLQVTGWRREEVIGRSVLDFLVPESRERTLQRLRTLGDGIAPHWSGDPGILTKDGKVRWFQANSVLLRDASGAVEGVASLAADVTDHRALQEQYLQARKLEGLGRLAGGVAHDFNNLLTVINGYSDLVIRKLAGQDSIRSGVEQIRKAGARAADLTQQLLAFSRKQVIQPRPLDLNFAVAEAEEMLRRLLGEDIELVTRLSAAPGLVMADTGQLHQVLMNLAANARDAMPEGGRMTVETARSGPFEAGHPDEAGMDCIRLSVSDTGLGFPEETRKFIFEPFFTTKPVGAGTGLGLATVYGIVKQNQGWIDVQSVPGNGTRFDIWLPIIDFGGSGPEVPAEPRATERGAGTLLLVEDQDEVRDFATTVLEEVGYRVIAAADGAQALVLARHPGPIDLMVTDVIMPGMNGRELAEKIGNIRPGIPILFTSGYSREVLEARGLQDREFDYLPKPYAPETLVTRIGEAISRQPEGRLLTAGSKS